MKNLVALALLLSFWCVARARAAAKPEPGFFDAFRPKDKPDKKFNCYECAGEKSQNTATILNTCAAFRRIKKNSTLKNKDKRVLYDTIFKVECPVGIKDCYSVRAYDRRVLGYEERGCGNGPKQLPAEPDEKCEIGEISYFGEKVEMENCVCTGKNLCNQGSIFQSWSLANCFSVIFGTIWNAFVLNN